MFGKTKNSFRKTSPWSHPLLTSRISSTLLSCAFVYHPVAYRFQLQRAFALNVVPAVCMPDQSRPSSFTVTSPRTLSDHSLRKRPRILMTGAPY